MPVVAIVDAVKIDSIRMNIRPLISMPVMQSSLLRLKSGPAGFYVVRCLPRSSTVCYLGLPGIKWD